MDKNNIIVVGSLNMDYVIKCKRIPRKGETIKGESFSCHPGGKGANQAAAVAKLGCKPVFIGARGDDTDGKELEESLIKDGVLTDLIISNKNTGTAHIFVNQNGDSYIVIISGANEQLTENDVEERQEVIKNANYILLQFETPVKTVFKTIEIANKFEKKVILDPAPAQNIPESILKKIDHIIPNTEEINQLTPQLNNTSLKEKARYLIDLGVKNVIVTCGEKGVNVYNKNSSFTLEPPKVDSIDTTGAGDAFAGAFVVGLNQNLSLKQAVEFAMNYAALTVTKPGAQSSYISKEEFFNFFPGTKGVIN